MHDSIDTHQAALATHTRAVMASKAELKDLVTARKRARADLVAATARAAQAAARYDKAVLAHLVRDAKTADQNAAAQIAAPPATRPVRRAAATPPAKSTNTAGAKKTTAPVTPAKRARTPRVSTEVPASPTA